MDKERRQRFLLILEISLREAIRPEGKLEHYLNESVLKEYSVFDYEAYSVETTYLIESAVTDYRDLLASATAELPKGLNLVLLRIAVKDRLRLLHTAITLHDPQRSRGFGRSGDTGMLGISTF